MTAPPRWPGGARCVVCVTIHFDGESMETGQGWVPTLGTNGRGRYSARRGVPRMLDILARRKVPASFFVSGYDAEQHPGLMREIVAAGHEVAAHGWLHEGWDLGAEEPALLERAHQTLIETTGTAPTGWCSPSGRKSALTVPMLRRLGYRYDASEKDDDIPYVLDDGFCILPNNTVSLDDVPAYRQGQALASEVLANWLLELDAIREGEGYLHLILHPRAGAGSGTPARAANLDAFLERAAALPDVAFLRCDALAEHVLANAAAFAPRGAP